MTPSGRHHRQRDMNLIEPLAVVYPQKAAQVRPETGVAFWLTLHRHYHPGLVEPLAVA